jgi:glucokinase
MASVVIAADLGGTNLRSAAVNESGEILYRTNAPTPRPGTPAAVADLIGRLAEDCRANAGAEAASFGIAVPAILEASCGHIFISPNLPLLNGSCFGDLIAARTGLKISVENDANAAAIGEHWLGASRGTANSLCVTLGTGVGGGLILEGQLYRGSIGTAGEIGHICVEKDGLPCGCGSRGCLEQYASATAIARMARERGVSLPEGSSGSAAVYEAAKAGNADAADVFRIAAEYLGLALAGLVNVLNPEAIVIGGGAAAAWDLFSGPLTAELESRAFGPPTEGLRVVRAMLGDDAGLLGAARIALDGGGR